jgi:hypothetical protein
MKKQVRIPMKNYLVRYLVTTFGAAVSLFVLTAMVARAQTNLVADGSFESTPIGQNQFTTAWSLVAGADNNSDYGVATATGGHEIAEQGTNFAYFRGHPTDDSQDCLGQYVNLTVGALYHISYWMGTDGPLTNGAAMWAQIGASYGLSSSDVPLPPFFPHSATALPYQEFSTNWIANSGNPILSFHGINATNGLDVTNSILLDNVSMVTHLSAPDAGVLQTAFAGVHLALHQQPLPAAVLHEPAFNQLDDPGQRTRKRRLQQPNHPPHPH